MKLKKRAVKRIKSFMNRLPYVSTLHKLNSHSVFPAGHFCSPVVSLDEMKLREDEIWGHLDQRSLVGIDLNTEEQLQSLDRMSPLFKKIPFQQTAQKEFRYYFDNAFYSNNDGSILFAMINDIKPKKIIEIGSGFSSALMMDVNQDFFDNSIQLTFVEPYPENRLVPLMEVRENTNTLIIKDFVQNVSLESFSNLDAGDILFVDSSHVVKTGSDVNYILFEILPVLKNGVIIHFHDIHFPFEYPKSWVLKGFCWNETYALKAFLMYNNAFKIRFFTDYMDKKHPDSMSAMPLYQSGSGSSLWLEKM